MTTRKRRVVAKNFKTIQEWDELGFELKSNEPCVAFSLRGPEYAECQVKKKKKKNDKQQLQDSDNKD